MLLNLGILAHVDAGKTTVTEQLLLYTGAILSAGTVDKGTASTDWLAVERERGISVRSAQTYCTIGDLRVNLIDTPGHTDFVDEVERALSVLDAAVLVVSAAEGVQAQTRVLLEALEALQIPTLIFLNKCDRIGCEPLAVVEELQSITDAAILPLNTFSDPGSRAVSVQPVSLQDLDVRSAWQEQLADRDEQVEAAFLEDRVASADLLTAALRACTAERTAFPLVYGAAALGVGISALADAIAGYLPAHPARPEGEVAGVVYKIEHDPRMGKITYVRLEQGTLKNRDAVYFPARDAEEKVTQIRTPFGSKARDAGVLVGGDIAAVCGFTDAKVGDRLGRSAEYRAFPLATPLFTVQVLPPTPDQLPALVAAMGELSDENPLLSMLWLPQERELHIRILGKIQLEVLHALLLERYNLAVTFTPPSVIYKETPTREGIGFEAYTMPKPCWAVIKLAIEPGPRGSGLVYESQVQDRQILHRYQAHIATTVPQALEQGLYGWEVTDLKVTLIGGEHHLIHTHPLDFFLATPMAVMNGLDNCGTTVLEPINRVRLAFDESLLGRVVGDLLAMRGQFDTPVFLKGEAIVEADLPVATSADYPSVFASLTHGNGRYAARFARYDVCPDSPPPSVPRRGIDPRDRSKWILAHRGAIAGE